MSRRGRRWFPRSRSRWWRNSGHLPGKGGTMSGSRLTSHGAAETPLVKVPPHSLEAEQAVLASVLLNNDLMNDVVEILRPDDFYQGAHRTLFSPTVDLSRRGRAIDQLHIT